MKRGDIKPLLFVRTVQQLEEYSRAQRDPRIVDFAFSPAFLQSFALYMMASLSSIWDFFPPTPAAYATLFAVFRSFPLVSALMSISFSVSQMQAVKIHIHRACKPSFSVNPVKPAINSSLSTFLSPEDSFCDIH